MRASLFFVLAFRTAVLASPPNPTNVTFTSLNFRNILQWFPGKDTPADTKYRVRYAIYGESKEKRVHWRSVPHCTDIAKTWCDLSAETSDLEHGYYAKVRAMSRKNNSEWVLTTMRFSPKSDTEFGPPHLSVKVDDKYVVVTIEGPMKYLPNNHTPQVSMATLYPHMTYVLSIHNTHSGEMHHITLTRPQYKYRTMDHGTELCFSANTKLNYMPSKHHSSAWQCIDIPEVQTDRLEKIVIISTAVPVVLLCLLAGSYVLYKYLLGTDEKSPVDLRIPTFFPPPLSVPSEKVNIIVIQVPKDDIPIDKLYPKLPNPSPELPRHEAPLLAEVPSKQMDDYGFVSPNVDLGQCDVKNQDYKAKELMIQATSSGRTSQNSFLQSLSSSGNPLLLNQSGENQQGLRGNTETGGSNDNEGESAVSSGYATQNVRPVQPSDQLNDLSDDYGFVTSAGYASQNARSMQPMNQIDLLPDSYGLIGPAAAEETEDPGCLQLNWSSSTGRLVIPGLELDTGRGEGGSPPGNRVHLDTVFVRQPSEEDALLGAGERSGSGQWDAEEFMAKWDLVLLDD